MALLGKGHSKVLILVQYEWASSFPLLSFSTCNAFTETSLITASPSISGVEFQFAIVIDILSNWSGTCRDMSSIEMYFTCTVYLKREQTIVQVQMNKNKNRVMFSKKKEGRHSLHPKATKLQGRRERETLGIFQLSCSVSVEHRDNLLPSDYIGVISS